MKIRRKIALLATSALVLQAFMAALPPQARAIDDDNMAAFLYWKLPLGAPNPAAAEPTYGFSVAQTQDGWLMPPPSVTQGRFLPPPLLDLHFGGGDADPLPTLNFSGVDVGMVIDDALYQTEGPGPNTAEWILIAAGTALTGVGICAALGCFDGDDDDNVPAASSSAPASSSAAFAFAFSGGEDAPAIDMLSSY